MASHRTKRALEHAKQDRNIRYGARHRPGGVLAVTYGDNAFLRYEADGRLQSHDQVVAGGSYNRAVSFSAHSGRAQVGSRRNRRARAGSACVEVQNIGIPGEAAARAPAVEREWDKATEVGPLG